MPAKSEFLFNLYSQVWFLHCDPTESWSFESANNYVVAAEDFSMVYNPLTGGYMKPEEILFFFKPTKSQPTISGTGFSYFVFTMFLLLYFKAY